MLAYVYEQLLRSLVITALFVMNVLISKRTRDISHQAMLFYLNILQ